MADHPISLHKSRYTLAARGMRLRVILGALGILATASEPAAALVIDDFSEGSFFVTAGCPDTISSASLEYGLTGVALGDRVVGLVATWPEEGGDPGVVCRYLSPRSNPIVIP